MRSRAWNLFFISTAVATLFVSHAVAQSNPAAMTLPVSQNWGTSSFSTMPVGFVSWNGLSGTSITTQAAAEASTPTGDVAGLLTGTPANGGQGGSYGYVVPTNDARFGILNSSATTNGVNQLALAINTSGQTNIVLTYEIINAVANTRVIGAVCQYRVGVAGAWTTLAGIGNPYVQSGGTAGDLTSASITLPAAAENQPVVQIRWATWRGTGAGNSSGLAIDNINISSLGGVVVTGLTLSGGPTYNLSDTAIATVTLSGPPDTSATISVSSGAFPTATVIITAPDTSGTAEVEMATDGTFTAIATGVSGAGGSATSNSFTVVGAPTAAFAATGNSIINDSSGNGNGFIEPGENGIQLTFEITNNGTANASSVSGTLTSLTPTATVTTGTRAFPDLTIGQPGSNSLPFVINVSPSHVCGTSIDFQLAVTAAEGSSTIPLSVSTCPPSNGLYDPPADYYLTATGTGATLKAQLHNIISKDYWNGFMSSSSHHVRSYDAAKTALQITDLDPNNSTNLILMYTGVSVPKVWDAGATWNREHQWPNARGLNDGGPDYSDLINLRPCNPNLNSSRGDQPYGIGAGYWDPDHGAPVRGDAARSMFYMDTRYDGSEPNTVDLTLVNGMPSGNQMGDLAKLLEFHYADPVSQDERRRNYLVFSNVANPSYNQGNRNPFIDHPEFVWTIWGSFANDSRLYVSASPPPDGTSNANVDLGAVIVNAPVPVPQTVVLSKTGSAPTTFDILLTGAATSPAAGPRQAFSAGTQARNISAGLSVSTAVAGSKSGAIIIDNTDLTSAAPGQGSADGNDSIAVNLLVFDHANGSFATSVDQNALTIDFGSVPAGSGVMTQPFAIYNLIQTPGFTARLDGDSIAGAGDTARLYTNVAAFSDLAAGSSLAFTASFDTAAVGVWSATWTIATSDENIPGATAGANLVLTLMGTIVPSCSHLGDLNQDSFVNGADVQGFINCLLNVNPANCGCADMDHNSNVTTADIPGFAAAVLGQ